MIAVVMLLVAASAISAFLITLAELPDMVVAMMQPLVGSPVLLMLAMMVFIMVVGMVMDLMPTVLILVPVLMPLIVDAGIDPVYFGVLFILNCSIGLITPPVSNVLNVIAGVSRLPFEECVKGVLPYLLSMLGLLVLMTVFYRFIIYPSYSRYGINTMFIINVEFRIMQTPVNRNTRPDLGFSPVSLPRKE